MVQICLNLRQASSFPLLLHLTGDPEGNWEINRSKRNKCSAREIRWLQKATYKAYHLKKSVLTKWRAENKGNSKPVTKWPRETFNQPKCNCTSPKYWQQIYCIDLNAVFTVHRVKAEVALTEVRCASHGNFVEVNFQTMLEPKSSIIFQVRSN